MARRAQGRTPGSRRTGRAASRGVILLFIIGTQPQGRRGPDARAAAVVAVLGVQRRWGDAPVAQLPGSARMWACWLQMTSYQSEMGAMSAPGRPGPAGTGHGARCCGIFDVRGWRRRPAGSGRGGDVGEVRLMERAEADHEIFKIRGQRREHEGRDESRELDTF